jgi:hypothetical protein
MQTERMQIETLQAASDMLPMQADKAGISSIIANQVRVSGGFTHAPGCINPDTGRMVWPAMQARMGGAGGRKKGPSPAPQPPRASDYSLPIALVGTTAGRLYAELLVAADTDGIMPSLESLCHSVLLRDYIPNISRYLGLLVDEEFLTRLPDSAGFEIVATGQHLLRSARSMARHQDAA